MKPFITHFLFGNAEVLILTVSCPFSFFFFNFNLNFQFPIGIDSDRFIRALKIPEVQEHIEELKERFKGRKVYNFLNLQCGCFLSYKI